MHASHSPALLNIRNMPPVAHCLWFLESTASDSPACWEEKPLAMLSPSRRVHGALQARASVLARGDCRHFGPPAIACHGNSKAPQYNIISRTPQSWPSSHRTAPWNPSRHSKPPSPDLRPRVFCLFVPARFAARCGARSTDKGAIGHRDTPARHRWNMKASHC